MRTLLLFLSFFLTLTVFEAAQAQAYRRLVNFEWEPIEGASSYELEIQQTKKGGKLYKFKEKKAEWSGRLTPGAYTMRVRALDYRRVPGDWSASSPFDVGLEAVRTTFPKSKAELMGKGEDTTEVEFRWQPVPGAVSYQFELNSSAPDFKHETTLKETKLRLKVPVAETFSWKIQALGKDDIKSEAVALSEFTVLGPRLASPKMETPENEFVREIVWEKTPYATKYDVAVAKYNPLAKKWEKVHIFENVESNSVAFDDKWTGGQYKAQIKAKSDRRAPSPLTTAQFKVRNGDRSPAAEFTHEVRKSIDRINGWYGIASYLITQVSYSSTDFDGQNGLQTKYPAIGGTGRVGLGHFKENNPWGFLGVLDLSGFMNKENKPLTYMSMEGSAVWRTPVGDRGEFRSQMGLYYKEHQVALAEGTTAGSGVVKSYENAAVVGPHVSGEYWYSFGPKLGFQVNAHLYYGMLKMKTPNGQDIEPTLSTQFGFLGSYRFSRRFTGLAGYSRREDRIKYKSNPINAVNAGKMNEAALEGNYLNFFAEYSF
ncbi:MAG TPA: hypothetical protein PL182_01485 [Pseudobdellovibrionaceae bacterium]|nr:hypothetical protein [Pseudobdellovibrionaceae bacterium]